MRKPVSLVERSCQERSIWEAPRAVAVSVVGACGLSEIGEPVRKSSTAASICKRGLVRLTRVSVTATPVAIIASRICVTLALGTACRASAQAPATWGAAIDVPLALP